MCGVIGGYCREVPIVLDSILSSEFVYHRGHDSSGIATIDGSKIRKVADVGFFGDWSEEKRGEINKLSENDIVSLHIRYSTIGDKKNWISYPYSILLISVLSIVL